MQKLDRKTLKNLTVLSRIACTEEEEESLLQDLRNILVYVEQLSEVETEGVVPCNHVIAEVNNVMREDEIGETLSSEEFLSEAPERVGGWVKVPPVIKKG